ncbi:hypothetical protein WME97_17670 [Sorangium sp. So ce367]|jgi:hypothetical protein|uniref:hypothetical protein n=1 Tax=Sorangium sp. So ce367 TaxID=3133305 RepID=UPI003F5FE607
MTAPSAPPSTPSAPATPQAFFDYHRTVIGYHGTRRSTAQALVDGAPFTASTNDDDWLGHGIYFWEYAPQQAWWWARRRYGEDDAAVVGAMIHLGRCLDLLDPANARLLGPAHANLLAALAAAGQKAPGNANTHKYLDCAVFQYLFSKLDEAGYHYESVRAVFVPLRAGGMPRLWERSGVFEGGHIQISVREPRNILAVWSVRKDGRYGKGP